MSTRNMVAEIPLSAEGDIEASFGSCFAFDLFTSCSLQKEQEKFLKKGFCEAFRCFPLQQRRPGRRQRNWDWSHWSAKMLITDFSLFLFLVFFSSRNFHRRRTDGSVKTVQGNFACFWVKQQQQCCCEWFAWKNKRDEQSLNTCQCHLKHAIHFQKCAQS